MPVAVESFHRLVIIVFFWLVSKLKYNNKNHSKLMLQKKTMVKKVQDETFSLLERQNSRKQEMSTISLFSQILVAM